MGINLTVAVSAGECVANILLPLVSGRGGGVVTGHLNNHGAIIPLAFQKRYCIKFCKRKSLDVDIAALIDVAFAVFIVL